MALGIFDNSRMVKVLLIIIYFISISKANAGDSFFLEKKKGCVIKRYNNEKISPVDSSAFVNRTLDVKVLKKNPTMVAFKIDDNLYVTSATCVDSVNLDYDLSKESENDFTSKRSVKSSKVFPNIVLQKTTPVKHSDADSHDMYFEFDLGRFVIGDESQVFRNYNETFPSTTSNPTSWSTARKSKYSEGPVLSVAVGFVQTDVRSFVLKVRSMSGKKTDTLTLTDINSGTTQTGDFIYEDSFLNLYAGYRFSFLPDSYWRPSLSGYLGLSRATTKLPDNSVTYNFSSLGIAFLTEVGLERMFRQSFSISSSIGLEFLGARNLKFEDTENTQEIKTKMSYNNSYLSLGIKYYF